MASINRNLNKTDLIDRVPIEDQSNQTEAKFKKIKGFSIGQKTHSIDRNSRKLNFFEKLQKIMQYPLNPNNFMNEMHENEFKFFFKTFVFNLELQNKIFKLFTTKFSTLEHILYQNHRIYNLGWPN